MLVDMFTLFLLITAFFYRFKKKYFVIAYIGAKRLYRRFFVTKKENTKKNENVESPKKVETSSIEYNVDESEEEELPPSPVKLDKTD